MDQRRKEANAQVMMDDYTAVAEIFQGTGGHPNWLEVKKFVRAPVKGEGQLGTILRDIESAISRDNEREFYEAACVAVRMLRRQAHPMGQQTFGE